MRVRCRGRSRWSLLQRFERELGGADVGDEHVQQAGTKCREDRLLLALAAADADSQRHLAQLLLGNADESLLEPRNRSALQVQKARADLSDHAALLEGTALPVLLEDE